MKMAYDISGKPFEYNYSAYRAVKNQEKQEAVEAAKNALDGRVHRQDPAIALAINRYNARHSQPEIEIEQ